MEHIVQFAIGIDDEVIRKRIEESAYDDVINKLMEDAKDNLPKDKSVWGKKPTNWRYLVDDALDRFIEKNRDEIINAAAEKLCDSYKRTKVFKEKMADAMEEVSR